MLSQLVEPPTIMFFFSDIEVFSPRRMYRAQFQANWSKHCRDMGDFIKKTGAKQVQKQASRHTRCREYHLLRRHKPCHQIACTWLFSGRSVKDPPRYGQFSKKQVQKQAPRRTCCRWHHLLRNCTPSDVSRS